MTKSGVVVDPEFQQTLAEFKSAFKAVSGPDLSVNLGQLKDIFETMGAQIPSEADFRQQFDQMDIDGDGLVSFEELEQYLSLSVREESNLRESAFAPPASEDAAPLLSSETISAITKLFEDNKVHSAEKDDFVLNVAQLRQIVADKQDKADDTISLEAFDAFFSDVTGAEATVTQSQFSALVRDIELKLLNGAFQVTDMDGRPYETASPQTPQKIESQAQERQQDSQTGFPEPVLQKGNSSVMKEKEGNMNLANFAINALKEYSDTPQVQLQELLTIFVEYNNFTDFRKKDWCKFFGLLSSKFDIISEKLSKAETDRDIFMHECQAAEAKYYDYTYDCEEEKRKRELIEADYINVQQKLSDLVEKNQNLTSMEERNANLEKLQKDTAERLAIVQSQLMQTKSREKDLMSKTKDMQDRIHDMNVELQTVKVWKSQELDAEKLLRSRQLQMLDIDNKIDKQTGLRHSMAFQNSSRLSKIGPSLQRDTLACLQKKKYQQPQQLEGQQSHNRFTVIDQLVMADQEINGEEYNDIFTEFNYPKAQELNETREKLYLRVMQSLTESLDPGDPQYEIQEKAIHSIAAEYIKNRKAGDILLEELRGYEEQMVELETDFAQHINQVQQLEKAREDDREIREEMLAEIRQLEETCEQYRQEIERLEKDLLNKDCSQQTIREKINQLKINQSSRMSLCRGSEGYQQRINAIKERTAGYELQGLQSSFALRNTQGIEGEIARDASIMQREYSSMVSTEFQLEKRSSQVPLTSLQISTKSRDKQADKLLRETGLIPIQETLETQENERNSTFKLLDQSQESDGSMVNRETVEKMQSFAEVKLDMNQKDIDLSVSSSLQNLKGISKDLRDSQMKKLEDSFKPSQRARKGWGQRQQQQEGQEVFMESREGTEVSEDLLLRESTVFELQIDQNQDISQDQQQEEEDFVMNEDSSDDEEEQDKVFDLDKKHGTDMSGRSTVFDQMIPTHQSPEKDSQTGIEEERKTLVEKLKDGYRTSKITEMLSRASNVFSMRQSLIQTTSNRKDFDYLYLRRSDNTRFYKQVHQILHQYYEDNQLAVFSEIVQMYNPSLKVTEMIIMVTAQSIYLLDRRGNLKSRCDIKDLKEIILVKANPCFFALSFRNGIKPLVLQSFRRAELIIYVLSQAERVYPKPGVVVGDALKVYMKSGKTKLLEFDKALMDQGTLSESQKRLLGSSQLNNFVNALACGYLDMLTKGFFGGNQWNRFLVVLSNVGLLYFKDPLDPPMDLFPILNCQVVEVNPSEVEGATTVFRLEYARKQVTFRCCSLSEYSQWVKAITQLQQETEGKRNTLKARELARITEMQTRLGSKATGVSVRGPLKPSEVSGMSSFRGH